MRTVQKTLSLLIVLAVISGCASNGKGDISSGLTISSEELEIGQKIHQQILSQFYVYTDPQVVGYVTEIGNSLAQFAARKLSYRFTILYSDKIYATSAPGGFVYITTAFLHFLQNESELAAVMAHEIGELQYQDPRLSKGKQILDSITQAGATIGPAFGQIGSLAVLGLVMLRALSEHSMKSPEDKLIESDENALRYMVQAGYDPQGLIDVLYRFLNADNILIPYFSDYYEARPITEKRFEHLQKNFSGLPLTGKRFSTHRANYQEAMQGVHEIYK